MRDRGDDVQRRIPAIRRIGPDAARGEAAPRRVAAAGYSGPVLHLCYSERDFAALGNVSRRQRVWCSEVVTWVAEFRVYVIDHRVVAVDRYDGDGSALDMDVVESAVAAYHRSGTAPSAYGIDFGVLANGETALVEANDGYALGAYDIAADRYTELVLRRWSELVETASG
ncbi:ATP-grasp domain-containing protein [Nocardia amikacinitolerans]|uniref:ATP-grasp domain-containing protein n=1 Tax=Nocardia amikacinitolerans TaxID=756689 RepID=UPI0027E2A906|nr:ATP-grasp domain-containing protein [Nocardia amikacinitolerans]